MVRTADPTFFALVRQAAPCFRPRRGSLAGQRRGYVTVGRALFSRSQPVFADNAGWVQGMPTAVCVGMVFNRHRLSCLLRAPIHGADRAASSSVLDWRESFVFGFESFPPALRDVGCGSGLSTDFACPPGAGGASRAVNYLCPAGVRSRYALYRVPCGAQV